MWLMEWYWLASAGAYELRGWGMDHVRTRRTGQSTVEYALVGALVVIAAAGALTLLGGELTSVFTRISDTLKTASSTAR